MSNSVKIEQLLEVASGLSAMAEKEISSRHHDNQERLSDSELLVLAQAVSQMVFDAYQLLLTPAE